MREIRSGTFEWSVDRFLERKGEMKESSKFQIWSDNCYLSMPGRDGHSSIISQYYTLYIENFRKSMCSAERTLKLCLIGANEKEILSINRTQLKCFSDFSLLLMTFRDMELRQDENDLLPGGTLTVRLSWYEERDEKRPVAMLETLSKEISCFFKSNGNTDCVLKVGDTEFRAHRAILSARCEVFAAMFRHETAENRNGVVEILDVDANVISDFLHYIYSGKVHGLTASTAAPLFVVAEKYGIILLQEACLSVLMDNLSVENVCEAAVLADTYEKEELEKKVVQFIGDRMAEVQGSAKWKRFLRTEPLATRLLYSLMAYKYTQRSKRHRNVLL